MLNTIFLYLNYSQSGVFTWTNTEETVSFPLHLDELEKLKKTVGKILRMMTNEKYESVQFKLTVSGDTTAEYKTELYVKSDYHLKEDGTFAISEKSFWDTMDRHVSKSRVIDACAGVYMAAKAERDRQLEELEQKAV